MTRYAPSRKFRTTGVIFITIGVCSACVATEWLPAIVPGLLFLTLSVVPLFLSFRPAIELRQDSIRFGASIVPWRDVSRFEHTWWLSLLVVYLTLTNGNRLKLLHPGTRGSSERLLRELGEFSTRSLSGQTSCQRVWSDFADAGERVQRAAPPVVNVLNAEDEADVERMYQRLKSVGHLDSSGQNEES